MVEAICTEITNQQSYLGGTPLETIYFGGGTPSILETDDLLRLLETSQKTFGWTANPEITLEANPDDLHAQKLKELKNTPINRLSIGVQSFFNEDLLWMNRSHNGPEAESAIKRAQDSGFENITADLIYGYPLLSDEKWIQNIQQLVSLQIPHISSYSLTVEKGTALHHFVEKKKQVPMDEAQSARQFNLLMEACEQAAYQHYEISNFAKEGQESKHNSNYWKGKPYLGIGPSAHSFNQHSRQWNVANNAAYIKAIQAQSIPYTVEELSIRDRFNEYLMTGLRTMWGVDLTKIRSDFGEEYLSYLLEHIPEFIHKKWLLEQGKCLILSTEGKLFADQIASSLFLLEDEN